jgi:hypothetical protein
LLPILIHTIIFFIAALTQPVYGISFKKVSSWITGAKETTFFQEHPIEDKSTVTVENYTGTIVIKSWSLPKVAIEAIKSAPEKDLDTLDIKTISFPNHLSIKTTNKIKSGYVNYQLIVPVHTNLIVKTEYGSIKIKNVEGTIQATTDNGSIDIQGAAQSIQACASGSIASSFSRLPLQSCVSLKSLKNAVNITLPTNSHATIKAFTTYNAIISQHFLTLKPITVTLNKQTWDTLKRQITGTIGNGGASIDISAHNGIRFLQ